MTASKNSSQSSVWPCANYLRQVTEFNVQDVLSDSVNHKENGLLSRLVSHNAPLAQSADIDLQTMWIKRFTNPDALDSKNRFNINLNPKPTLSEIREGFLASGVVLPIPGVADHVLVVGRRLLKTTDKAEAWILPAKALDSALLLDSKTTHYDKESFDEIDVRHFRLALFLKSRGITEDYLNLRRINSLTVLSLLRDTDIMQCYAEQTFINAKPEKTYAYLLPSLMQGVASAYHRAHGKMFAQTAGSQPQTPTTENPQFWEYLNQTLASIFSLYIVTEDDLDDWVKRQERSLHTFKKQITVRDTGSAGFLRLGELIPLRGNAPLRRSEDNLTALKRIDLSYPGGTLRIGSQTLEFNEIATLCRTTKTASEQTIREVLPVQFHAELEASEMAQTLNELEGLDDPVSAVKTHAADLKKVCEFLAIHSRELAKQIDHATLSLEQSQFA